jgi:mannan endo-1,4-beta-mannosidase
MSFRPSVIVLASCLCASAAFSANPADPAAPALNPRGRAILAWFQQLQAAPELRLVSGQFGGWSGTASIGELGRIHEATGRWPAMLGLDYCGWDHGEAIIAVGHPNQLAQAYWNAGGLVNISWHAPNPANPKGGGLRDKGVNLRDLLTPGTPTHERWMKSLDAVAAGLQELQAAGIVVIWRPLHEMNGGWFWWGAKEPADFIAVWRHMFDYLTHTKGLHNLIWAYSPNHGQKPVESYYPGDAYTDLIGLDAYTDHINPDKIIGFDRLAAIRKPVGFTEFGPHGASNPPGDYDFRRLLDGIEKNFPHLRHFLVWNEKWNPASNRFAREFYNDPRVITRDQLPAGLAGN